MNSSHANDIHETHTADIPDATPGNDPEMKSLDPNAPYKHAPPRDGDPWTTILTPELEADTLRCNAWKEEVQNLLIFAGLFSGVVTAFLIQAYKLLEPDPNNTVIALLFHIANSQNSTSPFPPSVNPEAIFTPFSQTAAWIRINVFWFISLILGLTTVLIGTIALQWLREHQSYIGYSGKEKLAILHMRKEAAEAWYLPQIFAALPLLLQGALVLFLAGLVEFTLPLGRKVTIPISFLIGLILLFLAATTILPSLQGLAFFFRLYPQETLPTPCPFKSPQSLAFRKLYGIVLRAIFRIFPPPSLGFQSNSKSNGLGWVMKNPSLFMPEHLAPSAYDLWYQNNWLSIDREWLSLRDACHQRLLDDDPDLYHHRIHWKHSFPLSDVTQSLVKAVRHMPGMKHTEPFLAAIVHCFQEISESIWTAPRRDYHFQRPDRRNRYFEQLHWKPTCSMSKFLLHGGDYQFERFGKHDYGLSEYLEPKITQRLFCDDQTVIFLRMVLENHDSPRLAQYQLEMWSRILQFSSHVSPLTATEVAGSFVPIPTVIEYPLIYSMIPDSLSDQRITTISNVLSTLLKLAASHRISHDKSMNSLCTHSHMVDVLNSLAYLTTLYLRAAPKDILTVAALTRRQTLHDVDNQIVKIFEFMGDHLNKKLSNSSSSTQEISLDVFFYFSSIFIWGLLHWLPGQEIRENTDRRFAQAFESLLAALHRTWVSSRRNVLIETRFGGHFGGFDRFSDKWWRRLFQHIPSLQVHTVEQDFPVTEKRSTNSGPYPSSNMDSPSSDETKVVTAITLYTTSPDIVVDHSSTHRTHHKDGDIDDQQPCPRPNSHPHVSGPELPSNLDSHADGNLPHSSPADLPGLLNYPTMTPEDPDFVNNFPLSHAGSLSEGRDGPCPSNGDHLAADAVPLTLLSHTFPPPDAADPASIVPQQVTVNEGHQSDLQSDNDFSIINVQRIRTVTEQVKSGEAIDIVVSGNGPPQDQSWPGHAAVHMESSRDAGKSTWGHQDDSPV